MIQRSAYNKIIDLLDIFPAVCILGPRQIGKTTLAHQISESFQKQQKSIYLDLEDEEDRVKLNDPIYYFKTHEGCLIVLDEIQRMPEIFAVLRGVIDRRRRAGESSGQFLILGSASLDLLKQSSESLAGRLAYQELGGISASEIEHSKKLSQSIGIDKLWMRGGFPNSLLAKSDADSFKWRKSFVRTYLEREIPQIGPRIPAATLRRLWTMLAHQQGGQLNVVQLASSLDLSPRSTRRYIELLEDLLLVRTLRPWFSNIGKRLVKAPKVYIRDSGLMHTLLGLASMDDLLGHAAYGTSWEGFVLENLLNILPDDASPWFYRTAAGAEIDLVIETGKRRIAIEIKRSLAPKLTKGFYLGCEDIKATERFVVYPGLEKFPLSKDETAIPLPLMMNRLQELG
ncbi:ATP-binding protein [bacterium]|nr:ATP-binding protein [bacterium]MBP9811396.1 ATP-binding protein [bacterium]